MILKIKDNISSLETTKNRKAPSFEEAFVPGAGVEPARFPTGV